MSIGGDGGKIEVHAVTQLNSGAFIKNKVGPTQRGARGLQLGRGTLKLGRGGHILSICDSTGV